MTTEIYIFHRFIAKLTKETYMTIDKIKRKAKKLGINCGKMKKAEIIHSIQTAEGNMPCFGTTNGSCEQVKCCFIKDCLKIKA